jgi:hypothetical protein
MIARDGQAIEHSIRRLILRKVGGVYKFRGRPGWMGLEGAMLGGSVAAAEFGAGAEETGKTGGWEIRKGGDGGFVPSK